jgi:hypothetical protein
MDHHGNPARYLLEPVLELEAEALQAVEDPFGVRGVGLVVSSREGE